MSTNIKFERMEEPNIYGYCAVRDDGIQVEVVRCYEDQWNVFMTDGAMPQPKVIARAVEEYRLCKDGYMSRFDAFKVARSLLNH